MTTPFSFVKEMKSSNVIIPCLNVSPITDMITGKYTIGPQGITYMNGGSCRDNAVVGGNNTQKTGFTIKDMARGLYRFEKSLGFVIDIEATYDVDRLAAAVDHEANEKGYFVREILNKRFFYYNRNDDIDGTWIHNFFKDLNTKVKQDIKDKKDVFIKTPYLGNDGEQMEIIIPIFIVVDSISELNFHKVSAHFQEGDVDEGGEKRTRDMAIGNMRRIVYEDANILGGASGVYQYWTAQVVDTINMTGRPQEKESVFLRQGKKLKAPKSLMRIPQVGYEIIRGSALKQGQEWMYPNPFGKDVVVDADARENPDLLMYSLTTYRNKSGGSGASYFFIGSQSLGIQEGLTMYHSLKTANMFGLEGSVISHACVLYPELKVGRTTVWEKSLSDRKFERALVICYQMWFMQTFWLDLDKKYRITPKELYEKIKEKGLDWDNILENTVDYWFTNPAIKKKTVTTMELLKVALGEREAYWVK